MDSIKIFQEGNYVQYPTQCINNGQAAMIVDRIASIDNERITTQKGLVITKKLAESQFFPVPIESAWLTDMGFEKHCKDEIFSIWEQTLFDAKENKHITIIIIDHNENKLFFLGLVNEPLYAHSLQNLFCNITGRRLDLPIRL